MRPIAPALTAAAALHLLLALGSITTGHFDRALIAALIGLGFCVACLPALCRATRGLG